MKTITPKHQLLLAISLAAMASLPLSAATIVRDGSATGVTAIGSGTTIGADGYDLLGAGSGGVNAGGTVYSPGDINASPTYATVTTNGIGTVRYAIDTNLTVDGSATPTLTAAGYYGNFPSDTTFATISFNSDVPSSLRLGILINNSPAAGYPTHYIIALNGSTSLVYGDTSTAIDYYSPAAASAENDILYVQLDGLTSSDTLTIGTGLGTYPNAAPGNYYDQTGTYPQGYNASLGYKVGGFVFDNAVVAPEPSTYALFALGFGALAFLRFRKTA